MENQKTGLWQKIKPWLIILSAIPAILLVVILLQIVVGLLFSLITGTKVLDFEAINEAYPTIWQIISYTIQFLAFYSVVRLYWVKIFKYPFISIGFERTETVVKELIQGFLTGVFLIGVIFILLLLTNQIEVTSIHFSLKYFLFYIFMYLIVGFNEELLFRGYLLGTTMKLANKYTVLLLFAFLFSLAHFLSNDFSILPVINIFLAGLILGIYYIHTKRLWYSISLHFTWNFFQGPVLGSNVSGGTDEHTIITQNVLGQDWITGGDFGFEGSVIMTIILIPLILLFHFYLKKQQA